MCNLAVYKSCVCSLIENVYVINNYMKPFISGKIIVILRLGMCFLYMYVHVCVCMCTGMYIVCACAYVCVCTCVCVLVRMCLCIRVCMCLCVRVCMCLCVHVCVSTLKSRQVQTYAHTIQSRMYNEVQKMCHHIANNDIFWSIHQTRSI